MKLKLKQFTQNLITKACAEQGIKERPKIVLGLSGGPDSIFLLHILAELKNEAIIELTATHLDHQWRAESARDVEFCHQICNDFDVKFIAATASDLNLDFKFNGSKEELGRRLRRKLFETVLQSEQAHILALAHHAQDQQETFFIRLIRGTTLSGLRCMEMVDGKYLRPLLDTNKAEIVTFLDKNKITYLTDPTNASDDYLRNRIRKYVLPALKQCDERFELKFKSTLDQIKLEDDFLKQLTSQEFERIFDLSSQKNIWVGKLDQFQKLNVVLQRRITLHWLIKEKIKFSLSSSYLDEVLKFLNSKNGGQHKLSEYWQLCKKNNFFHMSKH
ncbi:MAG: tRNA(Ile)-lysidine synthase [candidate division TM6 bacterium GW2011_GWF2_37_49]|nr:MAG: tRNA(Ile)-lysidine synthase [candidate division TM6 bacterium GW2011_GWF2_37_49]